jgi:hypothetical protein
VLLVEKSRPDLFSTTKKNNGTDLTWHNLTTHPIDICLRYYNPKKFDYIRSCQ